MKKVILMVAMVFATSGLVNANSSVEEVRETECEKFASSVMVAYVEDYGCQNSEAYNRLWNKANNYCETGAFH